MATLLRTCGPSADLGTSDPLDLPATATDEPVTIAALTLHEICGGGNTQ